MWTNSKINILAIYKSTLSFFLVSLFGFGCRFKPTCSEYASEAIDKHGFLKGSLLALKRVARCNPFGKHGFDPVPSPDRHGHVKTK